MPRPGPDRAQRAIAVAPTILRTMNQRVLLDHLFEHGPATRPQLAKEVGLSQPTVFAALSDLHTVGLVRTVSRPGENESSGRPPLIYEANPAAGSVVVIDLQSDVVRLVLSDLAGAEVNRVEVPNVVESLRELVDAVRNSAVRLLAATGRSLKDVTQFVVVSPGVYEGGADSVLYAAQLPGDDREHLAMALEAELGAKIAFENDVNLAALREYSVLADDDSAPSSLAMLHIGRGVGLGTVINGQLYRGHSGAAGEIGLVPYSLESEGSARHRAPLEHALAAEAFVRYAHEAGLEGVQSAAEVIESAKQGQPPAQAAIDRIVKIIASVVTSIAAYLDPEIIVIAGEIGQALSFTRDALTAELEQKTLLRPSVRWSRLGSDAGAIGALMLGTVLARDSVFTAQLGPTADARSIAHPELDNKG